MSEEILSMVLDLLPAPAFEVKNRSGLSHEETYAALVRLHDQGRASMLSTWRSHTAKPLVWSRA